MFEYAAQVVRVIDGDTLVLDIDLGLSVTARAVVRVAGVNAPELPTPAGEAAKAFVEELVTARGAGVLVRTVKDRREKYGRYLADISWPPDQAGLAELLLTSGNAVPYNP